MSKRVLRAAIIGTPAVAAALALGGQARAANQYWDQNGTAAGGGTSGAWDNSPSTTNWTSDPNGTSTTSAWVAGNTAIFSAGTATAAITVTASGTLSLSGINVEDPATLTLT